MPVQKKFHRILGSALTGAAGLFSAVAFAAEPAALNVLLTPQVQEGKVSRIDVQLKLESPKLEAGKVLLRAPIVLVGTPMAGYGEGSIVARDDNGELPLKLEDEGASPTGKYRRWLTTRATAGDVTVSYGTAPRQVNAETRNGPLFDLRSEAGGVIGSGNYFYALPDGKQPYRVSLKWDLSKAPKSWRGIWSLGEGEASAVIPTETLAFSYYAAGPVKSYPDAKNSNFGLYWLATPPFDVPVLAAETEKLYTYMAKFFGDEGGTYRVFIRGNPYPAGGGTALAKSFMFAYGAGGETASSGDLQMLLAHEMAHNWPRLDGDDHASTAWYTEGTAEYYSIVLALRAGAISLQKFRDLVNEKANDYHTNVYRDLSNAEAGKKFWQDPRAQKVPYGRGLMYLFRLNALLLEASSGKRSLDDLVLNVLRLQRSGQKVGIAEWEQMVAKELGEQGKSDFDKMVAGTRIELPATTFAPCFKVAPSTARPFELGFDEMRLGAVSHLREGSPAAKAGLKEGDKVLRMTPIDDARKSETKQMEATVLREEKELKFTFLPRAEPVPSVQWTRVPGVPDSSCKI